VAEVLLFHHAQGLTPGVVAFADELRSAGHVVRAPDLYEGRTFDTVDEGVAHAREVGFDTILDKGVAAADDLPAELVYAGFSLGGMPAQKLAQTRPGARGGLMFHAALPLSEFGGSWPEGAPLTIEGAELFLYPGDRRLFADNSVAGYDPGAAALLRQRALDLLARVG